MDLKITLKKIITVVSLELVIAIVFVIGIDEKKHALSILYHSYFADILIPFGFYFLLVPNELRVPMLRQWEIKALLIFALCSTSEILQYFGIFALARVFDPMDFVMYGVGVALAIFVDRQIFTRILVFWN